MTTDIHASIRAFLQQQTIMSLAKEPVPSAEHYNKAGVIPYIRQDDYHYYVMKPRGERPDLGAPLFQLCKGTRMYMVPGVGWRDMREEGTGGKEKESMAETALREGIEELGLKLDNITRILDMGPYSFSSATTGKGKKMWLFAAEVKEEDDFASEREVALTTGARQWVTLDQFAVVGRQDHHYILRNIEEKLRQSHKE